MRLEEAIELSKGLDGEYEVIEFLEENKKCHEKELETINEMEEYTTDRTRILEMMEGVLNHLSDEKVDMMMYMIKSMITEDLEETKKEMKKCK